MNNHFTTVLDITYVSILKYNIDQLGMDSS